MLRIQTGGRPTRQLTIYNPWLRPVEQIREQIQLVAGLEDLNQGHPDFKSSALNHSVKTLFSSHKPVNVRLGPFICNCDCVSKLCYLKTQREKG